MSLYCAEVGVYEIKKEYRDDLQHFLKKQYDEVTTPEFTELVREHKYTLYNRQNEARYPWCWNHNNYVEKWKGKYNTSLQEGIFTFGMYINTQNSLDYYCWIDFKELLEEIGKEIERDSWMES